MPELARDLEFDGDDLDAFLAKARPRVEAIHIEVRDIVIGREGFALPSESDVRRLADSIAPGAVAADLGDWMSRNLRLRSCRKRAPDIDVVLRIHPAHVTERRLAATQRLRGQLAGRGLEVALPIAYDGSTIVRCGRWVAEIEPYLPNRRLPRGWASYAWLLYAVGRLHRIGAELPARLPTPVHAVYASAGTLARWSRASRSAVHGDSGAEPLATRLTTVTTRLRGNCRRPGPCHA